MGYASKFRLILGILLSACVMRADGISKDKGEFFETRVRPVLAKNCFACHTNSKMGGLQLDSLEHVLQGGKDGPVVVPGDPDKSLLIQAVRQTHARYKMPPAAKLSDQA